MAGNKGRNPRLARRHNRALAMKTVIQAGGLSRKSLAARIGLTGAAISGIVDELIEKGLLRESPDSADAPVVGRKPIPLSVNPDVFRILTVYLGRSQTESYLTNASGGVLRRSSRNSRDLLGAPDGVPEALHRHIAGLMDEWRMAGDSYSGIAVTAPGPVRMTRLAAAEARHAATWALGKRNGRPFAWDELCALLSARLGCPVFAENDANAMALGEHWFGCGRECSHFALYTIGEGIGAAAIINGSLYRGHSGVVSLIGHITVNLDGPKCSCGNAGCLELYAGFRALRGAYLGAGRRGRSYHADLARIFAARAAGDPAVSALVEDHARVVAVGAVSLANMFGPEKIVVASYDGAAIDLDPFVAGMRASIREKAFSAVGREIVVERSMLGADILAYGGTALVMDGLLGGETAQ